MRVDLHGQDGSKVAYVVIDNNDTSYAEDAAKQANPPITGDTVFAVFFNNRLYSINLQTGAAPERLTLYRFQEDANTQFPLAVLQLGEADIPTHIIDMSAANGEEYEYIMYPEDSTMVYAGTLGNRPSGESYIEGYVACETLITANWSDEYGAYLVDRIFYFDANNQPQPINNNAVVQKNQTFGRFFHLQHGATNVLSGQLSSMIGYVDCKTMKFVSSFSEEDAIRWLTTDNTTKFYKSARGYVLPVDITSAITFTPDRSRRVSDVSFEWTERYIPHPASVIGVINA